MKKAELGIRPDSWIQGARTKNMPDWIRTNPKAFRLLYEFAERSRRDDADIEYNGKLISLKVREFVTGRKNTSERVGISEQEYRSLYKKLERLNLITTVGSTTQYTIGKYLADGIFFNNYSTEEPTLKPPKQPTDNQPPTTNNKYNNENNGLIHSSLKSDREENNSNKKHKCPNVNEGHGGCIEFVNSFAESRGVKFPNFGKQINALHKLLAAGYLFDAVNRQIDWMEKDRFWVEKGFDLMNVANEIGKANIHER